MQKFLTGDKNLDSLILSKLSNSDLINIRLTAKYGNELYNYEPLWYAKLIDGFPSFLSYKSKDLKIRDYYLRLTKQIYGLSIWFGWTEITSDGANEKILTNIASILRNEILVLMSERGHLEIVKYLVDNGCDVHYLDDASLESAVEAGHLEVVKYLMIEKGVRIVGGAADFLKLASKKGHIEIVKYFLRMVSDHPHLKYLKLDSLQHAIQNGHLDLTKYLLENENINYPKSGLLEYARKYSTDIVEYLSKSLL